MHVHLVPAVQPKAVRTIEPDRVGPFGLRVRDDLRKALDACTAEKDTCLAKAAVLEQESRRSAGTEVSVRVR